MLRILYLKPVPISGPAVIEWCRVMLHWLEHLPYKGLLQILILSEMSHALSNNESIINKIEIDISLDKVCRPGGAGA